MNIPATPRNTLARRLVLALCLALALGALPAQAAGTTWYVVSSGDDEGDGNLDTRSGSLRFALAHAASGDFVSFDHYDAGAETIFVSSLLVVPAGVALGHRRDEPCGNYAQPLVSIADSPLNSLNTVMQIGAGATLRGLDIGGGKITLRTSGPDVEVCGVGLGLGHDNDQGVLPRPPLSLTLSIDGPGATIHRNYLNGDIVVSANSSDTRIGDTISGEGEGDGGIRDAAVTILADDAKAAQRVTVRDPFPRALHGLVGGGVPGGDDVANHANNWVQTPVIASATTSDAFATVEVRGLASPNSLVDIFFDNQATIARQPQIRADGSGAFSFSGPLPTGDVEVFAVSTLDDAAHPARRGSSSKWSAAVHVVAGTPPPTPSPTPSPQPSPTPSPEPEPQLSAIGSLADLSGAPTGETRFGDLVRLSVTLENVGQANIVGIASSGLALPDALTVVPGSGAIGGGGAGFVAADGGFSGGTLAPGARATYTLDLRVAADAPPGSLLVTLDVNAVRVVTSTIVGRIRVVTASSAPPQQRIWLPFVQS